MAKKYDLAIKLGEYTAADGSTKHRYQNLGAVMESDKGPYILLNALFLSSQLNGLANRERRDSVIVSMFEPKGDKPAASKPAPGSSSDDPDDTIPF